MDNQDKSLGEQSSPLVRTMIIGVRDITLSRKIVKPAEIIKSSLNILPGCLVPSCTMYVDGNGLYKEDLCMNTLANPLISNESLIRLGMYGGPLGTIVLIKNDGRSALPFKKIRQMYQAYDDDLAEDCIEECGPNCDCPKNEWTNKLNEAIALLQQD